MKYIVRRFAYATKLIIDVFKTPKNYYWFTIPLIILLFPLLYVVALFDFKGNYGIEEIEK